MIEKIDEKQSLFDIVRPKGTIIKRGKDYWIYVNRLSVCISNLPFWIIIFYSQYLWWDFDYCMYLYLYISLFKGMQSCNRDAKDKFYIFCTSGFCCLVVDHRSCCIMEL